MSIVPFEPSYSDGFRSLVADTLREFDFEPDLELDGDLDDPGAAYSALWVAVDGDDVVGSVALRDLGGGVVELKRMYLRPAQRGRGLGRELLALAIGWACSNGMTSVRLDTSERMVAAQRLYEAHGFERVEGGAPRQGQCRFVYELRL
ncbi:MAG: GNAT family N-acetyltransferase [Gaiellaceae bacterium]|jgi:GNAT superfamily N-acetyltransferase